ncbi:MAG TPA: VWA domain-containing protein [Pyrinomonadaceae bacterium]
MKITVLFWVLLFFLAANVWGQNRCLADDEAKKLVESIRSSSVVTKENKKLRKELLEMREESAKLNTKISQNLDKNRNLIPEANQTDAKNLLRVCQIIKENGWLTKEAIAPDGFDALAFLIGNNKAFQLQRELFPVLVEAAKKSYVGNPLIASLIDNIRVGSGLPQIFGTQAVVRNDVIYLHSLLNEERVDEWRKTYDLPPLANQIRGLERRYLLPVLKMQRVSKSPNLKQKKNDTNSDTAILGISDEENEVLKIDTKLVNLNVRVMTKDLKVPTDVKLSKEDFTVLEDGVEQEIVFFSTTEQPFDLVLLLDFSGSTVEKRSLIKKAAQRFVEYARPTDRISVVVFADEIKIISEFTTDKNALAEKIKNIEMNGGSPIWDSLKFTYENLIKKESVGRRSAVVFMTDGEDYSRKTTFADTMEMVRNYDTTIFPVYLDTGRPSGNWEQRNYRKSQQSLLMLAEETGGQFYKADDAKDLRGVYEQVINDLGKVYSIGYEPKSEIRDGGWRNLTVTLKTKPGLIAKTRLGYYAN